MDIIEFAERITTDKGYADILSHLRFCGGRVQASDGKISIEGPADGVPDMVVPAEQYRRLHVMEGEMKYLEKQDAEGDFVHISKGRFRAKLPKSQAVFPFPDGDLGQGAVAGNLRDCLDKVEPFISKDASRPWACSALVQDGWVYASNNITIVRTPTSYEGPVAMIPGFVIPVLHAVPHELQSIWISDNLLTFVLSDITLKSVVYEHKWPDVDHFFAKDFFSLPKVPDDIVQAVEALVTFVPEKKEPYIHFTDGKVSTQDGVQSAEVDMEMTGEAWFHAKPLLDVLAACTHFDVSGYPKHCPFIGEDLMGVTVGVRM